MDLKEAKKIMRKNFIGPEELKRISRQLGIFDPFKLSSSMPQVPFNSGELRKISQDYILILGMPKDRNNQKLTINRMREIFGWNPKESEPCFYNQDWYLKERFAKDKTLKFKWYLMRKTVNRKTYGKSLETITKTLKQKEVFPLAVLTAFVFFAYYLLNNGEILWKNDFIWCSDKDHNGDRIYTGRYIDPKKINKNGFNIHRHLAIRSCYGLAPQIL